MRYLTGGFTWTVLLWAVSTLPARGEFIPWKYDWSADTPVLNADAPGTGQLILTDEALGTAAGSTDLVATNIRVLSTAAISDPDRFTNKEYSLTLFLLDENSGESGELQFKGVFNGTVSKASSNLMHDFLGEEEQQLILGGNEYTVTIGPYTPPGPPGASNAGAVSAFANVQIREVQPAPEPSTLILSCLALPFVGIAAWRKRRRDAQANVA